MGNPQGLGRSTKKNLAQKKSFRSKRRKRDVDQIREVMLSEAAIQKIASKPADGDLPGLGQFHCVACDRHFIDKQALRTHVKTKIHKRRIKKLRDEPYSHKEAEQAAGMGHFTAKTATVTEAVLEAATMAACADAADVIRERDAGVTARDTGDDTMADE